MKFSRVSWNRRRRRGGALAKRMKGDYGRIQEGPPLSLLPGVGYENDEP